jgi:CTP:molybdopterin cytidylyltransferase MocA
LSRSGDLAQDIRPISKDYQLFLNYILKGWKVKKNCSVIILAAGRSSRMGKPKFLLEFGNGASFLENIIRQYDEFGSVNIIVVLNSDGSEKIKKHPQNLPPKTQIVLNQHPEYGRFYSIKTGLQFCTNNYTFIHNVDNPFARKKVLDQLYNARSEADVIKPAIAGKGGHPVLISKKVCDYIVHEKDHNLNLNEVLQKFQTKGVEVQDDSILLNINSHNEFIEFMKK